MNGRTFLPYIALMLLAAACHKPTGNLALTFSASVDGQPLQQDTCIYHNAAGNQYAVTEVQYFISNVRLHKSDGSEYAITANNGAHYVDADIPGTLQWLPNDELPSGDYTSITFHLGLVPALNQTYFYPNPPENNMSWPAQLGGGYHYMKINGRWLNPAGGFTNFNLHTGIGQQRDANDNIIGFIDNSFEVSIPLNDFRIEKGESTVLPIEMNINEWFKNPNVFDFNIFGGSIMQNQAAQEILKANGSSVFKISLL